MIYNTIFALVILRKIAQSLLRIVFRNRRNDAQKIVSPSLAQPITKKNAIAHGNPNYLSNYCNPGTVHFRSVKRLYFSSRLNEVIGKIFASELGSL